MCPLLPAAAAVKGRGARRAPEAEHANFTQHIYELRDCHVPGAGAVVTDELLHYLKNWLNHHILIRNMAYKPYLKHNPVSNEVALAFGTTLADDFGAVSAGGR